MKIESSQISLETAHLAARSDTVTEQASLRATVHVPPRDTVSLSAPAESCLNDSLEITDPKILLIKLIAEMLTGHKVKIFIRTASARGGASAGGGSANAAPQPRVEVSLSYQRTETHSEAEQTAFRAQGVVETADGRDLAFSAELTMSREFYSQNTVSVRAGNAPATDPLVVNLDGSPAQVTAAKVDFDLNADGTSEKISFVSGGGGFLVLDRNGDGQVNDGRELFGPQTGNAFAELASYDADGNGWIDEGDPVYAQLRVWTKDAQGQDLLATLPEKGIGALSTSAADTEFALKDSRNVLQAQVRRSGVYLLESGAAGTTQQVDLVSG